MRPLELSLVLINLLTLGVFAVPQLHAVRWTGYVVLIAVLIAIVQIIVEGPPALADGPGLRADGAVLPGLAVATHHAGG
jgi:hypothetical protein